MPQIEAVKAKLFWRENAYFPSAAGCGVTQYCGIGSRCGVGHRDSLQILRLSRNKKQAQDSLESREFGSMVVGQSKKSGSTPTNVRPPMPFSSPVSGKSYAPTKTTLTPCRAMIPTLEQIHLISTIVALVMEDFSSWTAESVDSCETEPERLISEAAIARSFAKRLATQEASVELRRLMQSVRGKAEVFAQFESVGKSSPNLTTSVS